MPPPPSESVRITRLSVRGEGVAEGPVHVPGALPGELVAGEVTEGRIERPRILEPVPARVRPPCPHAKACGGCVLQHASDAFVAEWKLGQVRGLLERAGIETVFRPVATSPAQSRRRATLAGRRLKSGAVVGFHARASDTVVAIPGCRLLRPEILALVPVLEEMTRRGGSRRGELSFQVTVTEDGADLAVEGGRKPDPALFADLAALAREADLARLTWSGEPLAARRPARVRIGRALVPLPPGGFLQATAEGEAALTAGVLEACAGASRAVDLFAGAGTFTLPLAEAMPVHAVEGDPALLGALGAGWRGAAGLKAVTTEARDLFANPLTPEDLSRFDAAVLDPPRAGAAAQAERIAASRLDRLAYVSCNPASFARDAKVLISAGFHLNWLQVVDQFRWSTHIELVASLTRNR